ncbi:hypothetical protein GCM10010211_65860 [Streptomyces albospinus]|uniref:Uncharacterized protein n=1 Tax=Streptomyces albospinus TaxID=285515 RepID=A0ABQ2VIY0_9ACTN|nr:hypothetical protein [Streptomyces albospinus]GGU90108.1 hypothetical protein GCM10010211_65860 [Streptomyces albospinus]
MTARATARERTGGAFDDSPDHARQECGGHPAGGIGANTALRDASLLAAALEQAADGRPNVETVAAYESVMTGYGFDAVCSSTENGQRTLGQDPLPMS